MHYVIAVDKFKNSLTSWEAATAIQQGILQADATATCTILPLADGGDGLIEVMAYYTGATIIHVDVLDPLFRPITASYLLSDDGGTAIIEMAKASGLHLLSPSEYNCTQTTTYGTGQLIKDAIDRGVKKIILGIGGSATNEAGIGMAAALGYRFIDSKGELITPIGADLKRIVQIDASQKINIDDIDIQVACDVVNYLTGPEGASNIYAPQKGATPQDVQQLEDGMLHFQKIIMQELGIDVSALKGGGAAGGMGAGAVAFLKAQLAKGTDIVFAYAHMEEWIKKADVVITGEGKLDDQTLQGKVVSAVADIANQSHKPVIALCGTVAIDNMSLQQAGITAAFSIMDGPMSLQQALEQAAPLLSRLAFQVGNICKYIVR